MSVTVILFLVAGLVLLVLGAELLVRGASALAEAVGVSPLVVGLTVVAYGTSAPELAVSLLAGLEGKDEIAVANVVGSNIFNVVFILGLCALVAPLTVHRQLLRRDVPILLGVSALTWLLALDGRIGTFDATLLSAGIVFYTVASIVLSRREGAGAEAEVTPRQRRHVIVDVGAVGAGLALLVLGSKWLIGAATALAVAAGVSDTVIGLTLVAAGTSLPEVATSVLATIRGERDIAIGNVIGSNIYNLLAILGFAGLLTPGGLAVEPRMIAVELPLMTAIAVACVPIFYTGHRISRVEGALLFATYLTYTGWLVLHASGSPVAPQLDLPLAAAGVVVLAGLGAAAVRDSMASEAQAA